MKIHFNYALHPATHVLPACVLGRIGSSKPRPTYRGTTARQQVTCERCLKILNGR